MHADTTRHGKAPEITLGFWVVKILATTLGETGGDAVSMSLGWGYAWGTVLFGTALVAAVAIQVRTARFHQAPYWTAILASTMAGTTLADLATRSLGIGYPGGAALLAILLACSLLAWRATLGTVAVDTVTGWRAESFYWLTVTVSQTLGTAAGDWVADTAGLGYAGAAWLFSGALALLAIAWRWTTASRTTLFWLAFVLTRPLGAVVGDFLDKPVSHGGLALDRFAASGVLMALVLAILLLRPMRAAPVRIARIPGRARP